MSTLPTYQRRSKVIFVLAASWGSDKDKPRLLKLTEMLGISAVHTISEIAYDSQDVTKQHFCFNFRTTRGFQCRTMVKEIQIVYTRDAILVFQTHILWTGTACCASKKKFNIYLNSEFMSL